MSRKFFFTLVLAAALLLAISTIALAENPGAAAHQDGMNMPTATAMPAPAQTPLPDAITSANMTNMSGCPMMNGTGSMTGMGNMGTMTTSGMTMPGMSASGMMMSGMSNMPAVNENYVVLRDPSTWTYINPWTLLGWVLLGLVILAILAGIGLGIFWIVRRIGRGHPAAQS